VGELAEILTLRARMKKTELGVELIELVLHRIEIRERFRRERFHDDAPLGESGAVTREQPRQ
jgi:hypothetical protein